MRKRVAVRIVSDCFRCDFNALQHVAHFLDICNRLVANIACNRAGAVLVISRVLYLFSNDKNLTSFLVGELRVYAVLVAKRHESLFRVQISAFHGLAALVFLGDRQIVLLDKACLLRVIREGHALRIDWRPNAVLLLKFLNRLEPVELGADVVFLAEHLQCVLCSRILAEAKRLEPVPLVAIVCVVEFAALCDFYWKIVNVLVAVTLEELHERIARIVDFFGIHAADVECHGENLFVACEEPAVAVENLATRRGRNDFLRVLALRGRLPLVLLDDRQHKKPYA